jgi:hypothetical protein
MVNVAEPDFDWVGLALTIFRYQCRACVLLPIKIALQGVGACRNTYVLE